LFWLNARFLLIKDLYRMWQSSSKEDYNTFRTTPREHWWI